MKPRNLPRISPEFSSFSVGFHDLPYFLNIWHYHQEIELTLIKRSSGTLFVGDYIGEFKVGDILMFGSNLPHLTLNDKRYFNRKGNNHAAQAIAIHFDPNFLGADFFDLPEMSKTRNLLNQSKLGIKFYPNRNIAAKIEKIESIEGPERIIKLLEVLNIMSGTEEKIILSSPSFVHYHRNNYNSKLDQVYQFMFDNYLEDISLSAIAEHVNMNTSAFSRFFKKATNKSFVKFLIELRIGHACKLLLEDDYKNISEVCYESGFNNLSSFNKAFKKITGRTPSVYVHFHYHPNIITKE